jgi:hypothetical protein
MVIGILGVGAVLLKTLMNTIMITENNEQWITANEAVNLTGKDYGTIRNYCKRGLFECKRMINNGSSPLYINLLSIPSFMRKNKI